MHRGCVVELVTTTRLTRPGPWRLRPVSGGVETLSDEWFDDLTKAAASTTSRRSALKLLAGGLAGGLFSAGFLGRISSAYGGGEGCLPAGFACKTNGTCCNESIPEPPETHACNCSIPKGGIECVPRDECTSLGGSCTGPCESCNCSIPKGGVECVPRDTCNFLGGSCVDSCDPPVSDVPVRTCCCERPGEPFGKCEPREVCVASGGVCHA
jgi:hypothetical protein